MSRAALLIAALAALSACGPHRPTQYEPRWVAQRELTVGYEDGFVITSGARDFQTKGHRYPGLSGYVGCVPAARAHAVDAESSGARVAPLLWAGSLLTVAGTGGIGGIAFYEKDKRAFAGLLIGGFVVQLVGLVLVGVGAQSRVSAHGHALDAVNLYNDAAGSRGLGCQRSARPSPLSRGEETP